MSRPHWPLFDVTVRTPRLEVRYPDDELLFELAGVAAGGVHDPDVMPFLQPWTRARSPELERAALRYWWGRRASWSAERWMFTGAVIVDGRAAGIQHLQAEHFAVTRAVSTGSWLGRDFQGRGIGTEMRAAMVHLAFAGLGAEVAYSGAFEDNRASLGVSRSLGYVDNGDLVHDREGGAAREIRLKLTRSRWEQQRRQDIEISGLDGCLEWFGA